jgi:hypothetical protein
MSSEVMRTCRFRLIVISEDDIDTGRIAESDFYFRTNTDQMSMASSPALVQIDQVVCKGIRKEYDLRFRFELRLVNGADLKTQLGKIEANCGRFIPGASVDHFGAEEWTLEMAN